MIVLYIINVDSKKKIPHVIYVMKMEDYIKF